MFAMYLAHVLLSTYLPRHSESTAVLLGVGGSVFALYLAHILLTAYLPQHSGSTAVPQGGWGVVYLFCIWR